MLIEILKVYWDFEGKRFTGKVEFEKQGNNEVFISFLTDKYNQVIENGIVDIEMAENIKQEIIANNYNMTDYQIFDI